MQPQSHTEILGQSGRRIYNAFNDVSSSLSPFEGENRRRNLEQLKHVQIPLYG